MNAALPARRVTTDVAAVILPRPVLTRRDLLADKLNTFIPVALYLFLSMQT
jgi:hypothetical protein